MDATDAEEVVLTGGCCGCVVVLVFMGLGIVGILFAIAYRILG